MVAKGEMHINYSKNFKGICKKNKTNMTAKHEILKHHRCERRSKAYKCKIIEAVNTSWSLNMHLQFPKLLV